MATSNAPITIKEVLKLPSIGINPQFINFTDVKMESDKYICVRETAPQKSVVIIDMNMPNQPLRMSITADSAMMNPNSRILAFKNQLPGTTCDYLEIFDIEMDMVMRSHQMPKQIVFWQWITPKMLGLVTQTSVYHWSIQGDSQPVKMFDRTANLTNNQIISYRCDPAEKWLFLIGIAPGPPERPQLIRGNMQLFSVDQQRSQALEAHSASFASFKVSGNENPSTLVCFASKTYYAGQITSKLYVIELGLEPGKQAFTKKQTDLLFPPDFIDDFPVAMQISHKYGLIYVITKLGLLFVFDLETVAAVYRFRISSDPIFLTLEVSSIGGFYAVNRRGQLLLVTVNEATIVPFVSGELNNRELAVNIARRGNLPEAENLICQWFQELFSQAKYKEAAELAVESPQGILRTPDTLAKFQSVPVRVGQTPPLLMYFGILLTRGKLNAFESLELSRLVVNQNKNNLLKNWLAEDKLECSEELSDLVKTVDNDLAQEIYIKARDTAKVVAASADSREFEKILILSKQVADNDIAPAKSSLDECLPGESSIKRAEESTQGDFGSRKPSENSPDDLKRDSVKGRIVDEIQKELSGLKIDHHQDFDVTDELNEEVIETVKVVDGPKEGANGSSNSIEMSLGEVERKKMRRYSNRDLTSITKNFTDQVGSGAYGDVFKGKLPNGVLVAVKKLKDIAMNVMENTFMAEVRTMSNTSHRNLVRLYGYCFEASMKALVYEYLENGSLDKVLYENHLNLQWENLYDIAIGTAVGLSYLHEGCDDEIVHYDVKPGNVLLDSKLSPKVADFGMAKISQRDLSHISVIEFRGTRSYAAPEMWMHMPVTSKSDIYSFGMMLFEVLGRRRNLDDQNWLPGQVWEKFKKEKLDDIMEECGIEDKNKVKAKTLCIVALWCTQYKPDDRPIMSEVVQLLKGNIHRPSPPDPYYPYSASSGSSSWGGGFTKMSGPSIVSSTSI